MNRAVFLIGGLLLGASLGFFRSRQLYLADKTAFDDERRQAREELERVRERGVLSEILARLGAVVISAEQKDYTAARERSTRFFDALRDSQGSVQNQEWKQALTKTLGRRDEITADLAIENQQVMPKLRELYNSLHQLLE